MASIKALTRSNDSVRSANSVIKEFNNRSVNSVVSCTFTLLLVAMDQSSVAEKLGSKAVDNRDILVDNVASEPNLFGAAPGVKRNLF